MGYTLLAMCGNVTQLRCFAPPPYIPMPEGSGFTAGLVNPNYGVFLQKNGKIACILDP
jgi:hypothetical protein